MIEVQQVSKRFGSKQALNSVSFTAPDGVVTGFLGPNGSGKSTTMRTILGLVHPDSGCALVDGVPFAQSASPMALVGAVLDAKSAHPKRSAYSHLKALAYANNIPTKRVDEVMDMTGLASVKTRKSGTFSLGMSQRLSIAAALLADPHNLVLDEPINGLDPEGVKWVRDVCRQYAAQGRAVLLSSHLMSEVAITAQNLVIIGRGQILQQTTVDEFVAQHSKNTISVITPEPQKLHAIFEKAPHVTLVQEPVPGDYPADSYAFAIHGADLALASKTFAQAQLICYRIEQQHASLEDAYLELTHASEEYRSANPTNNYANNYANNSAGIQLQ